MANRLTRDNVIIQALDLADLPTLDAHDRPAGSSTIDPGAFAISWLQRAVDYFHNEFPWSGQVTSTTITLANTANTVATPADFILDVRDGVTIKPAGSTSTLRLKRVGLQRIINLNAIITSSGVPRRYTVHGAPINLIRFHPTADQDYTATLWYFTLPAVMVGATVPSIPEDWVLVEYLRLKCIEWARDRREPGQAQSEAWEYLTAKIGRMKQAGLMNEPESDDIPLDSEQFRRGEGTPWDWMGDPVGNIF